MQKHCLRRPNNAQTALAQTQAEIKVLIDGKEVFVQFSDLEEGGFSNSHAGGCNSRYFARTGEAAGVTIRFRPKTPHTVVGGSTHPEDYSGMLHRAVVVQEKSSDCADVALLSIIEQVIEPFTGNDLSIVIEKDEIFPVGTPCGEIVGAREIKRIRQVNASNWIVPHELECLSVACIVIHQNYFVVWVRGSLKKAFKATRK